ncbi:MAG: hypothetical protein R8M45_03010 [Ghiorsea sp.]
MHARQQIRLGVAEALTGLATTGANVSVSPLASRHLSPENTPALRIFIESDSIVESADMSLVEQHVLQVIVELIAVGGGVLVDVLDTAAAEVEAAMFTSFPAAFLQSTSLALDGGGELPVGQARLTYQFEYATRRGNSEVLL